MPRRRSPISPREVAGSWKRAQPTARLWAPPSEGLRLQEGSRAPQLPGRWQPGALCSSLVAISRPPDLGIQADGPAALGYACPDQEPLPSLPPEPGSGPEDQQRGTAEPRRGTPYKLLWVLRKPFSKAWCIYLPCHLIFLQCRVFFYFFSLPINNYRHSNGSQTLHYLSCQELDDYGVAFLSKEQRRGCSSSVELFYSR